MLGAAFEILHEDHVLPTSRLRSHLRLVRDYSPVAIKSHPAFERFVALLASAYPNHFGSVVDNELRQADICAFSLLGGCIASLTEEKQPYDAASATAMKCIRELIEMLESDQHEAAACRFVSHLGTDNGGPIDIGDLTITPVRQLNEAVRLITEVVPDAPTAFNRNPPFHYDPPHAVVVGIGRNSNPGLASGQQSRLIDRFLLLIRLLTAGTTHSIYEITGQTRLVGFSHASLTEFDYRESSTFQRVTELKVEDSDSISGLGRLLAKIEFERADMVATSFQMALLKFDDSYRPTPWYDQLVDLSTALEAILSGQDKEDVSLRLRSRAAALLSGPDDSASAIFSDVGKLYGLRSTLVHGGSLKTDKALRVMRSLSTINADQAPAAAVAQGVDRLRDLVRRALLARIALATMDDPLWPADGATFSVDETLADDEQQRRWRTTWRGALESIGAGQAADRPTAGRDSLTGKPL